MTDAVLRPQNRMVEFLSTRLDELRGIKTQREIARDLGYDRPNIISMFKLGETKVPLDKVPALAESLQVDFGFLLKLALEQYMTGEMKQLEKFMDRVVSDDEFEIVTMARKAAPQGYIELDNGKRAKIKKVFGDVFSA
ncbi:hypothetical protein [Azospirillum argentinense]|uniref:helix-turn-helix domain-containing protein n=1 Tax=Azospirillum argentinense TaxID=2970906 RepID=UPI0032DF2B8D